MRKSILLYVALMLGFQGYSQFNGSQYLTNCIEVVNGSDWTNAFTICEQDAIAMLAAEDVPDSSKIYRLMEISDQFFYQGLYTEAIPFNIEAVNLSAEKFGDDDFTFYTLDNLIALASYASDGDLLLEAGEMMIELSERMGYAMTETMTWVHFLMGIEYNLRDQLAESERALNKTIEIYTYHHPEPDSVLASFLISISEVYSSYLKHDLAIANCREAIDILDSLELPAHALRATAYTMLMLSYSNIGDINNMLINLYGVLEHIDYLEPLDRAAKFVTLVIPLVNYDLQYGTNVVLEAGLDKVAAQFTAELDSAGADPIFVSSGYMAVGNVYLIKKDYDSVYFFYDRAATVLKKKYGTINSIYMTSRNTMAIMAELTGRVDHAKEILSANLALYSRYLNENFSYLSEQEQANLLYDMDFNKDSYMYFFQRHVDDYPDMAREAADFNLQLQGILLRNVTGLRNRVLQQGKGDVAKFDEWIRLKEEAAAQQLVDEDLANALLRQAEEIEKEFNFQLKEMGGAGELPGWEALTEELKEGEAAIQFIRYAHNGYFEPFTNGYMALVFLPGADAPKVVQLCTEDDLLGIMESNEGESTSDYVQRLYLRPDPDFPEDAEFYFGDRLYAAIWEPLEALLEGVQTIYYNPSGMLNKVAFQALPDSYGSTLIDKYTLVQRRSLPQQPPEFGAIENLAAAGGIRYSQKEEEIPEISDDRGSGWSGLPGTLAELEFITGICEERSIKVSTLTESDATEEAFRQVVALEPDVLHIGTHGFFLDYEGETATEDMPGYPFRVSANPLLRSGLVLAGGNDSWTAGRAGPGDGILTASEIANLNLLGTELVVLSACETGLGDIQGEEGVYGLQRAFALAGAEQLIMSLWKVPDRYTAELMQLFYTALFNGKTPLESLREAQLSLSKKTGPYNWAAFVLVQ